MKNIAIGTRSIGATHQPFIIAEMSGNHNQSLERALEIVEAASDAGAHALKLQTYTADTLTLDVNDGDFFISTPDSLWQGISLHKLYQQAYTPWEWHQPIFERCRQRGMICFSTPFDEAAVDFLEELGAPCYKIASFENVHLPLIRKVAATGKPVIMSTGMATVAELEDAVTAARNGGCNDLILLKCTSSYPASPDNSNIRTIPHLQELFGVQVGLSDHTMGIGVSVAAVAFGATVIEKHFTLRRADGGVDSVFSLEPEELRSLVLETERAWRSLGSVSYGPTEKEKESLRYRRSLYISVDLEAGATLEPENVRIVRPGYGLPPKFYDLILGKKIQRAAQKGTPVAWDLLF